MKLNDPLALFQSESELPEGFYPFLSFRPFSRKLFFYFSSQKGWPQKNWTQISFNNVQFFKSLSYVYPYTIEFPLRAVWTLPIVNKMFKMKAETLELKVVFLENWIHIHISLSSSSWSRYWKYVWNLTWNIQGILGSFIHEFQNWKFCVLHSIF